MAKKPTRKEGEISTYRPGFVEGLTDATLGAALRQLERAVGASEREAYRRAGDVMRNLEGVTGWQQGERSVKNIVRGKGTGRDYLNVGLAALPLVGRASPLIKRGALAADEALLGQRTVNRVVPEPNPAATPTIFDRRPLVNAGQVTHARRNVSTAELQDAIRRGRFEVPKEGSAFNKPGSRDKWWSAADAEGTFGRPWKTSQPHTVRVPIDKVPKGRAVSVRHAEVYDPDAKCWVPVGVYAKKYAIGGVVIDDGNPAKRRKLI